MRVFPERRDAWVALTLFPFKAYVALALPFYIIFEYYAASARPSGYRSSDTSCFDVLGGYFLCIPVLLLGAIIQLLISEARRDSANTFTFASAPVLVFLFLFILSGLR